MKKVISIRNSYEEYLEVCRSIAPRSEILDLRKLVNKELPISYIGLPFGTCLIDYSRNEYKYVSENCQEISSYSKEEYRAGGLDFNWLIFHPEDKIIFSEQVFNDIKEFWKQIPAEEISEYRFSFNHRYFRKDGTISQILQHGTYLEPQFSGIPLLNLVVYTDISDFKTDTSIVLTVSRLINGQGYLKVFSKTYYPTRDIPLSKRESEILRLSLDGLSSKMIAEKLFISIQTVKNHKRNMMEKTSARNIAELIHLSEKNNWV
jgi:DNA-binding CsgD family transcriptional regulator